MAICLSQLELISYHYQPSVTLLSQFQNAPGVVHNDGIKKIGKYLHCHADILLTFKQNQNNSSLSNKQYTDSHRLYENVNMGCEEGKYTKG